MTQTVQARAAARIRLVLAVVAAWLTAPAYSAALCEQSQIRLVNSMREIAQPQGAIVLLIVAGGTWHLRRHLRIVK